MEYALQRRELVSLGIRWKKKKTIYMGQLHTRRAIFISYITSPGSPQGDIPGRDRARHGRKKESNRYASLWSPACAMRYSVIYHATWCIRHVRRRNILISFYGLIRLASTARPFYPGSFETAICKTRFSEHTLNVIASIRT